MTYEPKAAADDFASIGRRLREIEWEKTLGTAPRKRALEDEFLSQDKPQDPPPLTPVPAPICRKCNGSGEVHGKAGMHRCPLCNGKGIIVT
jgi:hypothetical protein